MSVRQLIVLGVALLAAVGALFMVRGLAARKPAEVAKPVVAVTGPRVLVIAKDKTAGSTLQATDLEWRVWSESAVSPSFVSETADPKALETFTGAVVRQDMIAGEPVIAGRLVRPGDQGFMAAIVQPGYRGVSVPISEETAASGFILPNDRVDVILTRKVTILAVAGGSAEEVRSGVVLSNVRVLAIDQDYLRAKDGDKPETMKGSVALLELSPRDSELLAKADEMGDISLALRPVQTEAYQNVPTSARTGAPLEDGTASRGEIKFHAFGAVKSQNVTATSGPGAN